MKNNIILLTDPFREEYGPSSPFKARLMLPDWHLVVRLGLPDFNGRILGKGYTHGGIKLMPQPMQQINQAL
jgi:hypothetical protein